MSGILRVGRELRRGGSGTDGIGRRGGAEWECADDFGAFPGYGLYRTRTGWVALGALEESFVISLKKALGVETLAREALEHTFLTRTAAKWETWGLEHDIPIAAVRDRTKFGDR